MFLIFTNINLSSLMVSNCRRGKWCKCDYDLYWCWWLMVRESCFISKGDWCSASIDGNSHVKIRSHDRGR